MEICILSVLMLVMAVMNENETMTTVMAGVLLILIFIGVYIFVKTGIIKDSYDKLLRLMIGGTHGLYDPCRRIVCSDYHYRKCCEG